MSVILEKFSTLEEITNTYGLNSKAETIRWIRKNTPLEKYYQTKIIDYLKKQYPHAVVWKEGQGIYSSLKGLPDVHMLLNGKTYMFEVKRPFVGVLSQIQINTIKKLKRAGAYVFVVSYVSEVITALKNVMSEDKE